MAIARSKVVSGAEEKWEQRKYFSASVAEKMRLKP